MKKGRIFVGLSGGVDSAVSAALLQREGYEVTGVFIRIALDGYPCPATVDRQEAMRVAAHLRIPFREIDLSAQYQERVFADTLKEFSRGRTPNPDTLCNKEIKFGLFWEYAMEHGANYVAAGHYARVQNGELHTSVDAEKDQSYFLWMVPQERLAKTIFPVGNKKKSEVRALAQKFKLPNAARKDSQGLCFLGDISLSTMLERELHPVAGDMLNEEEVIVGRHDGAALYTLGQRHGFTLSHHTPETKPHYVIAKDIARNTITVSQNKFPVGATATEVTLTDTNWIGAIKSGTYEAQFRYHQTPLRARLDIDGEKTRVTLLTPQYIAEGQSLVLFSGSRCLGGGVVEQAVLR